MGAFYSSMQSKNISDENDNAFSDDLPQPRSVADMHQKRLLAHDFDPRSPTEGIARTPIMVDVTPKPQGNRAKVSQNLDETPKAVPMVKDPRSPTNDFIRTPINPCYSSGVVRLETPGLQVTMNASSSSSPAYGSESGIESAEVSPVFSQDTQLPDQPSVSDSPDSAFSVGMELQPVFATEKNTSSSESASSNTSTETSPVTDGTSNDSVEEDSDDVEVLARKGVENIYLSSSEYQLIETTPVLHNVIRSRSQAAMGKKSKTLSLTPTVTRSPLSLVENSSRALSQRNMFLQGRKTPTNMGFTSNSNVRKTPTTMGFTSSVIDKENVFH